MSIERSVPIIRRVALMPVSLSFDVGYLIEVFKEMVLDEEYTTNLYVVDLGTALRTPHVCAPY